MTITSRSNPLIRQVKKLLADASARREEQLFVIEGARLCADAALSGVAVRTVLYTASAAAAYAEQLDLLHGSGGEVVEISDELSRVIGDTMSPQGVFCICEFLHHLDNGAGLDTIKNTAERLRHQGGSGYLALENVQDPANMGAVIRTAEALGLAGLLLSEGCCDVYNPKVLRGSMGGVFRLPLHHVGNMADAVTALQTEGVECWACVVDGEATPLPEASLMPGSICLIGNEGNGLRPETAAVCAHRLTIPMGGRAESLNASMAAGIVMWEMTRASRDRRGR